MKFQTKAKLAKACPFCGCKNIIMTSKWRYLDREYQDGTMMIQCNNCKAELWNFPRTEMNYNEACRAMIKVWNKRVTA